MHNLLGHARTCLRTLEVLSRVSLLYRTTDGILLAMLDWLGSKLQVVPLALAAALAPCYSAIN